VVIEASVNTPRHFLFAHSSKKRFLYSLNVLAQGREAGLPAKRPSGAVG
jgi:hypothetical protein